MTTETQPIQLNDIELQEWDDAKFRHAYRPSDRTVGLCGYDGPSTYQGDWTIPNNACPICVALIPMHVDLATRRWIKP